MKNHKCADVGYLFQNYALFPNMSVEENIAAGLKGMEKKKAKVGEMIERFRLTGLKNVIRDSFPAVSSRE
mgnify:CR=1 FL=1